MHNVPLEIWSAAWLGAAATGEKIIASDKSTRWQRAVGDFICKRGDPGGVIC
jgi:hypothetical protein